MSTNLPVPANGVKWPADVPAPYGFMRGSGGTLCRTGTWPGRRPSTGRPKHKLREAMRQGFDDNTLPLLLKILENPAHAEWWRAVELCLRYGLGPPRQVLDGDVQPGRSIEQVEPDSLPSEAEETVDSLS